MYSTDKTLAKRLRAVLADLVEEDFQAQDEYVKDPYNRFQMLKIHAAPFMLAIQVTIDRLEGGTADYEVEAARIKGAAQGYVDASWKDLDYPAKCILLAISDKLRTSDRVHREKAHGQQKLQLRAA